MEKASRVMYTIANVFNWILLIAYLALIVISSLALAGIMQGVENLSPIYSLVLGIVGLIVCLIIVAMVRRAKAKGSSKGWDLLFLIFGIVGGNIFYFLGGLFGLIAIRR